MVDIIKTKSIYDYSNQNPQLLEALKAWVSIVRFSEWNSPLDIVKTFGPKAVDILGKKDNKPTTRSCERAVIDIKGNNIRIIVKYQFHTKLRKSRIYIKWIGSHSEYDEVCRKNQQYEIEMFN